VSIFRPTTSEQLRRNLYPGQFVTAHEGDETYEPLTDLIPRRKRFGSGLRVMCAFAQNLAVLALSIRCHSGPDSKRAGPERPALTCLST
jgi:hypothetical protein